MRMVYTTSWLGLQRAIIWLIGGFLLFFLNRIHHQPLVRLDPIVAVHTSLDTTQTIPLSQGTGL